MTHSIQPYVISGTITNGTADTTEVIISDDNGNSTTVIVDGDNKYVFDLANWGSYENGQNVYVEVYDPGASFDVNLWDATNDILIDKFSSIKIGTKSTTLGHARVIYQGHGLAIKDAKLKFEVTGSDCVGNFDLLLYWYYG